MTMHFKTCESFTPRELTQATTRSGHFRCLIQQYSIFQAVSSRSRDGRPRVPEDAGALLPERPAAPCGSESEGEEAKGQEA